MKLRTSYQRAEHCLNPPDVKQRGGLQRHIGRPLAHLIVGEETGYVEERVLERNQRTM